MTTSTSLDKILSGSKKAELLQVLTAADEQDTTFGDFVKKLEERKLEAYVEAFKTITPADLIKAASGAGSRASTPKVEVPAIENFKDVPVRTAWKAKVLEMLEAAGTPHGGMFESRGLSPQKIREAMGTGNEQQGRELLAEMVTDGQIVSTGDTKGKKFVVTRLKAEAEKVHAEEVAKAKAIKDKKEADKAAADAEAAKAPAVDAKQQPVVDAPKAKPAKK